LKSENETWTYIWDKVMPAVKNHGCVTFRDNVADFITTGLFKREEIPQLEDINKYLNKQTNWRLKPVSGIISQRQYLNCLAFRTFPCTQYIRHHATPGYTPEPDVCHELFGHVAMFADPSICDISQKLGLLSLGATDGQVKMLGMAYWFTIEFGVLLERGKRKFYGAGIASSIKEIQNMVDHNDFREFNLEKMVFNEASVQNLQPLFYAANSFGEVSDQLEEFGRRMGKPFNCHYDFVKNEVISDRALEFIDHAKLS
jgi:phenylalanine-4-hydroxylase